MRLALSFLLSLAATAVFAHPENPTLRHDVQKVYRSWENAVGRSQWKKIITMVHPSYHSVRADGRRMSYSEFAREVSSLSKFVRNPKARTTLLHVDGHGDEVVAWIEEDVSYRELRGKKWVPVKRKAFYADTLKRTPSGWKFVYTQELPWKGE
jgi:hypothetical protein